MASDTLDHCSFWETENDRLKQVLKYNKITSYGEIPSGYPVAPVYQAPSGYPVAPVYPALSGYPVAPGYPATTGYPVRVEPTQQTATVTQNNQSMVPLSAATSGVSVGPLSGQSNSPNIPLDRMSLQSNASATTPVYGTYEFNTFGDGPIVHGYGGHPSGQKATLRTHVAQDTLTGQLSGPITGQASTTASVPQDPVSFYYFDARSGPSHGHSDNAVLGNVGEQVFQLEDNYAIADHDQAGVTFILA